MKILNGIAEEKNMTETHTHSDHPEEIPIEDLTLKLIKSHHPDLFDRMMKVYEEWKKENM